MSAGSWYTDTRWARASRSGSSSDSSLISSAPSAPVSTTVASTNGKPYCAWSSDVGVRSLRSLALRWVCTSIDSTASEQIPPFVHRLLGGVRIPAGGIGLEVVVPASNTEPSEATNGSSFAPARSNGVGVKVASMGDVEGRASRMKRASTRSAAARPEAADQPMLSFAIGS